jgi:DNA-binding NtrC family response regulator
VPPGKLTAESRRLLRAHTFPGNVRELENVLERALILAGEDEVRPEHLGETGTAQARSASASPPADLLREGFDLDKFERDLVFAAIERAGGNKAAAARLLGITRRRLYSMLQTFATREPPEVEPGE